MRLHVILVTCACLACLLAGCRSVLKKNQNERAIKSSYFEYDETVPPDYELGGLSNYPNPFSPSTVVDFGLPFPCTTSVEVVSVEGEKVRTLVDGFLAPGRYRIAWDTLDDDREDVASGIYFIRFSACDTTQIGKIVLLK